MKNTLAENMLRFGVKNLKESDVKQIKLATLNEAFVDKINGITWQLNFKNQDALDSFVSPSVTEQEKNKVYNGVASTQLTWAYWASLAFLGMAPRRINNKTSFDSILNMIIKAGAVAQNKILRSKGWQFAETKQLLEDPKAATFWNTEVINPANPNKKITRWELFYNTNIAPAVEERQALIATTPMTPSQPIKQ
jgi:hypothetical protein